jgi:hypothetical protein
MEEALNREKTTIAIVQVHARLMPNRGLVGSRTIAIAAAAVRATGNASMGIIRSPFMSTTDAEKLSVVVSASTRVNVVWL